MKKLNNIILSVAAAGMLGMGGLVIPQTASAQVSVGVQVGTPPPPLRYERVPAPRRGYVWAPGHWEWRGNRHVWTNGVWLRERRGYAYRAPQWEQRDGRWAYNAGRWDRDGDGVPNRADRRPNDPYRR